MASNTSTDYTTMTKPQLQAFCKEKGIEVIKSNGTHFLRRDFIDAIKLHESSWWEGKLLPVLAAFLPIVVQLLPCWTIFKLITAWCGIYANSRKRRPTAEKDRNAFDGVVTVCVTLATVFILLGEYFYTEDEASWTMLFVQGLNVCFTPGLGSSRVVTWARETHLGLVVVDVFECIGEHMSSLTASQKLTKVGIVSCSLTAFFGRNKNGPKALALVMSCILCGLTGNSLGLFDTQVSQCQLIHQNGHNIPYPVTNCNADIMYSRSQATPEFVKQLARDLYEQDAASRGDSTATKFAKVGGGASVGVGSLYYLSKAYLWFNKLGNGIIARALSF